MELIEKLSESGRELLQKRMLQKTFSKGDPVIGKGEPVSGAYFVLSGAVRVFTVSPDGKEATIYRLTAGQTCIFALNSLFNNILYPAWVEAEEDTHIAVLPGDAYQKLFSQEAAIQDLTLRALSSAVYGLMSELEVLHSYTVAQRLASYLLTRANSDGAVNHTQQEIAADIGTTREVVGRLVVQFGAQGLIESGRGRITLLNKAGLNDVLGKEMAGADSLHT